MRKLCLVPGCGQVTTSSRCPTHTRTLNRAKSARYGVTQQRARRALAATLPTPCGYCGLLIDETQRWDAAHVQDGNDAAGYVVSHPICNQREKR